MEQRTRLPRKTRQNTPLVTVCVPVYNSERFLKQALDSILRQTYRNIEVIVLDNCSTDGTPRIIRKYRDPRIRYVRHKKNIGGYPNFDAGISMAKGDYIAIYHGDDVYDPSIVEKELSVITKHPEVSCVFASAILIDEKGKRIGRWDIPPELGGRPITAIEAYKYILQTFRSPFLSPSCFGRAEAYKKAGHFATRFREAGDVDMYLRLTATGAAYLLSLPLVRYRHSGKQWSICYSTTYTKPNELFDILDARLPSFKGEMPRDIINAYEAHRDWDYTIRAINMLARESITKKDIAAARAYLRRSFTLRRIKRLHKEFISFGVTAAMLIAAHTGLGSRLACAINRGRHRRHVS